MILLDTHVLIWWVESHRRLGRQARQTVESAWKADELAVSSIIFWEMALMQGKARMVLPSPVDVMHGNLMRKGLIEIAVTGDIGIRAATLPDFHKDPADRLIVATALAGGHQLVTSDRKILDWSGPLRRIPAGV